MPGGLPRGGGMFKLRFDWYIKHKRKSLNFCHYVTPIKPRSYSTCHQELFYMWEIPFTLVFTCLFPRYLKIVTASLFIASDHVQGFAKCRRKCHRSVREKGTVTKARSLFVGSLESSSKNLSHWKNAENFCHKNSMARGWADTRGGRYSFTFSWPYGYVLL